MPQNNSPNISRRRFLKTAGATTLAAGAGPAVIIPGRTQTQTLRITFQRSLPSYNHWLEEYVKAWGERNNVETILTWGTMIDPNRQVVEKVKIAARRGDDIVQAWGTFEDHLIDQRDVYEECQQRYGKALGLAFTRTYNPKTDKYYGVCVSYMPIATVYRQDLWIAVDKLPDSWDDIRQGGRLIKFFHERPIGLGLKSNADSEANLRSLLYSFGGSVQNADNQPVLKSPQTLEALKFIKALYEEAMYQDVLHWDDFTFNNRAMLGGEISLTLNAVSLTRTAENKQLPINEKLWLGAIPQGPAGRYGLNVSTRTPGIWKFSNNINLAKQFIIDLVGASRQLFIATQFLFFPVFPQTIPELEKLLANDPQADPSGKYQVLLQAPDWSNINHLGYENPANADVFDVGLIPAMFANAVTGKMTPDEAMNQADQEVRKIYDKWRALGKV